MQKFVEINTKFDTQILSELAGQCSEFKFSKAENHNISDYNFLVSIYYSKSASKLVCDFHLTEVFN